MDIATCALVDFIFETDSGESTTVLGNNGIGFVGFVMDPGKSTSNVTISVDTLDPLFVFFSVAMDNVQGVANLDGIIQDGIADDECRGRSLFGGCK